MENSAGSTPRERSPNSFYSNLKAQIRVNPKNFGIKRQLSNNLNELKTYESLLIQELESSHRNSKNIKGDDGVRLDFGSSFVLFALQNKHFCDVLPDVELSKYKKVCLEMISKLSSCHEGHFGLARLLVHEGRFEEAEQHLNIAISEEKNSQMYQTWLAVLKSISSDSRPKAEQAQKLIESNSHLALLKKFPKSIELLWGLLYISLQDLLRIGEEIESPQHYASKIKAIDPYYGYLAWSEVLSKSSLLGHKEKSVVLLNQLILCYPSRPESYIKLWYYYYSGQNYKSALDVAENAFLNVGETCGEYSAILNLNYAKSLFRLGNLRKCFELLQTLYRKDSHFAVYLFHYGRMCLKGKDGSFIGSAIGALEECLKMCNESRHPHIYYWLMVGYLDGNDKIKAYEYAKKGASLINLETQKFNLLSHKPYVKKLMLKANTMKNTIKELHMDILNIEMLTKIIENFDMGQYEEAKIHCKNITKFDSLVGNIMYAKVLKAAGQEDQAVELLYSLLNQSSVGMDHYFTLCRILEEQNDYVEILNVCKDLMKKCKSPLVPVQVWISTHMLYIKALVKLEDYERAILILKSLAQVHPPPFIPDLDYLKQLQFATNKSQLEHTVERLSKGSSVEDSEMRATLYHKVRLLNSRKNLSSLIVENGFDSDSTSPIPDIPIDSEEIGCRTPEPLPKARISKVPLGDSANNGFSVSINYKFLYYIGKIAGQYSICIDDGLNAIHDFLNIHHYWMREGIESDEKIQVKAQYWQGVILYLKGDREQAVSIFKDILSMLFQLNLEKMTGQILKYLKEFQEQSKSG